ncbi:hypothetical protein BDP27DRAFT_1412401 [Rhodocollybia butyracea]|uniref:BHLH domain-containing protein n=1 Tax=Rhodocollybia butyracea TaxID=206335 RepID=A0A9P5QB11_9AGAR|nr:hypothetical protein BDP27DRAFT_1412401 [Rhodocollybia butyracea]
MVDPTLKEKQTHRQSGAFPPSCAPPKQTCEVNVCILIGRAAHTARVLDPRVPPILDNYGQASTLALFVQLLPHPTFMSTAPAALYNGSVNPSRRAKLNRMPERTLLPRPGHSTTETLLAHEPDVPFKRGRKPALNASGGLTRSARETQRKLNHSIIEKARRTKINDALAELARLSEQVAITSAQKPSEQTGQRLSDPEEDHDVDIDDDDDNDDDGDYGAHRARKANNKSSGSKSAKDSSSDTAKGRDKFKLDILVKTVENMQILLERVKRLDNELKQIKSLSPDVESCPRCAEREEALTSTPSFTVATSNNKRKRMGSEDSRTSESTAELSFAANETDADHLVEPRRRKILYSDQEAMPSSVPTLSLPSISSWLPHYATSAAHLSPEPASLAGRPPNTHSEHPQKRPQRFPSTSPLFMPYLPSPPSSTQFNASVLPSSNGVPILELGPSSVPVPIPSSHPSLPSPSTSAMSPPSITINTLRGRSESESSSSNRTPRTPEEESAASLLLHMSTSPPVFTAAKARTRRPMPEEESTGSGPSGSLLIPGSMSVSNLSLPAPMASLNPNIVAHTPSSMLGLGSA